MLPDMCLRPICPCRCLVMPPYGVAANVDVDVVVVVIEHGCMLTCVAVAGGRCKLGIGQMQASKEALLG